MSEVKFSEIYNEYNELNDNERNILLDFLVVEKCTVDNGCFYRFKTYDRNHKGVCDHPYSEYKLISVETIFVPN